MEEGGIEADTATETEVNYTWEGGRQVSKEESSVHNVTVACLKPLLQKHHLCALNESSEEWVKEGELSQGEEQ